MTVHIHVFSTLLAVAAMWILSGVLIRGTDALAKRLHRSGFATAFVVLGLLTSTSEASVAVNAVLEATPQVSAGNLVGASFVIFCLIIPALAVFGNGVSFRHTLRREHLALSLLLILIPLLFAVQGTITRTEGLIMISAYGALFAFLPKKRRGAGELPPADAGTRSAPPLIKTLFLIALGGAGTFLATKFLVRDALYFSDFFSIPASFIGLLFLSIGTNIPELMVGIRSVLHGKKEIALGDYIGSAAANTLIFGFLPLFHGPFPAETEGFLPILPFFLIGIGFFFLFSKSKSSISRNEGILLLLIYLFFVLGEAAALASSGRPIPN